MPETPIEILHLPGLLRADFTRRLPEATAGTVAEREAVFLSRTLAVFATQQFATLLQSAVLASIATHSRAERTPQSAGNE